MILDEWILRYEADQQLHLANLFCDRDTIGPVETDVGGWDMLGS